MRRLILRAGAAVGQVFLTLLVGFAALFILRELDAPPADDDKPPTDHWA